MLDNEQAPVDGQPEPTAIPVAFQLVISNVAMNALLSYHGIVPTHDLRLTVARELEKTAPDWLQEVVQRVAEEIPINN